MDGEGTSPKEPLGGFLYPALILIAACLAYSSSFVGVFVMDDFPHIVSNEAIRSLWPPWRSMFADINITRPLVGLSFAGNYAIGGVNPWSYHLVNLLVHSFAGLALFGFVRQTLRAPRLRDRYDLKASSGTAFFVALIWAVHPLNTQAVTYVTQRFQSLMGLLAFVALYAAAKAFSNAANSSFWKKTTIVAVWLGMFCKQDMVVVPLVIALYDGIFFSSSFAGALRERKKFYGALTLAWIALGFLHLASSRFTYAGSDAVGFSSFNYARTELGVIAHYLRLAFWPDALCFDYLWPVLGSTESIPIEGYAVLGALGLTLCACCLREPIGFFGAMFFLFLAPTSSFLPLSDPAWEYRMYVPLAGLLLGSALALKVRAKWTVPLFAGIALALAVATYSRNQIYADQRILWEDVIRKRPVSPRAYFVLGSIDESQGRFAEAETKYLLAISQSGRNAPAQLAVGNFLFKQGRLAEAEPYFRRAVEDAPLLEGGYRNLATTLLELKKYDEAGVLCRRAADQFRKLEWPQRCMLEARTRTHVAP